MTYRPFSEGVLNISNPISEVAIFLIFSLASLNLLEIPDYFHDTIDQMLVQMLNVIMSLQMGSSVFVFLKTIYLIIKSKRERDNRVRPAIREKTSLNLDPYLTTKS